MGTPNQQLTNILSAFSTQMSAAGEQTNYNNLYSAIMSSPALLDELNTAALDGTVSAITLNTAPGQTGASFQVYQGAINVTTAFLNSLQNNNPQVSGPLASVISESSDIFVLAHETQHSFDNSNSLNDDLGTATQQQNVEDQTLTQIQQSPSNVDITTAVNQYVTLGLQDEASANIAGWNAIISAAESAAGGTLSQSQLIYLEQNSPYASLFFNKSGNTLPGLTQNSDGSFSLTTANINAAAQIVGNTGTGVIFSASLTKQVQNRTDHGTVHFVDGSPKSSCPRP